MKILIFVSSQSSSKSAVTFGGLIARQTHSSVTLLTVIEKSHNSDLAHQAIQKARRWIPDLNIHTSIRVGEEADGILEEIEIVSYDLVILKARQAGQLKDIYKTSIRLKVSRQSPISVLIVNRQQAELNRILICTSGDDIADPVIEMGARLAEATKAKVTLLHVTGSIPSMYTGLEKIEEHLPDILQTDTPMARHLRNAVSQLAQREIDSELELRHGSVPDEILREAYSGSHDLIILGASKATIHLTGWLLGDVTTQVLKASRCPVMIVRKPELQS